ncbi:MAG TPA: DUF4340 domain-containing protein [Polyangiaceae bacterium]|jgi:hypothetical protein|nr:DUF4340 domain-containing protein [Polyangiaceae bacterium]
MALSTENKLYISLGVLAVLGGALFLQNKKDKAEAQSYTLSGQAAALPKIELSDDDLKKIDKITVSKPAGDAGAPVDVELTKTGEDWKLTKPVEASANQPNVKSLLDNLKTLKVTELIDGTKTSYGKFGLSDDKALHAVFSKGNGVALDLYFGESGGRGQMTRIAGKDGVYAVKGYSSYLYARDVKGWRDLTIFKFEDTQVSNVTIDNANGSFVFALEGDKWTSKFKKGKDAAEPIKNFEDSKLKDMLRAYKSLNADNFADKGKTPADVGLDKPTATVVFTLKDGAKREVQVGSTAEGTSRWIKATGSDEIWSISSWAVDWATADEKKFQKSEEKKPGSTDADHPNAHRFSSGGPGGMGAPPGMGGPPGAP